MSARPAVIALALAAALGGCAGTQAAPPSTASSTGTASSPAKEASTSSPATTSSSSTRAHAAPTDASTITLAFGGDVHFEEYLAPLARDQRSLESLRDTLGAADFSMVNLETAITERGSVIGKEFHFRAPASALATLQGAGVDIVSQANNHGVDYGPVGLEDTLAARATSPIPVVGIGRDAGDAFAPHVAEVGGLRVAFFGADQVYEMTLANFSADEDSGGVASARPPGRLLGAVTSAARSVDVVVVYLHWGFDYQACPDADSVSLATALTAAGADVIVGGHSHRVNGAGWLGTSYVAYGLGNFVWWRSAEPDSRTGVLTLTVDGQLARATRPGKRTEPVVTKADWLPMLIGAAGIPRTVDAATTARLAEVWDQARACSNLSATP